MVTQWGPRAPHIRPSPLFGSCLLCPNGCPSHQLLSSCRKFVESETGFMKPSKPFCWRFTMVYFSNPRWRCQQKCKFNVFRVNFWLSFPMFVTESFDIHKFLVYMTFTFKATDVRANNVKHFRPTLRGRNTSQASKSPNSA